ncbi:TrmH family RNA methyltransferase [Dyadobacter tibetensis]|uniref:TrmH family RNA methyltransferase n=1 Tax=Dyadobacter tibetensis TaxID=1211851 RepID=UPI0004709C73|nr:RNA methyltransferase [Dyadobacter tibetensis]
MLSKNRIKYINALKNKKFRQAYSAFTVEGAKSVIELIQSDYEIEFVLVTDEFRQKYATILSGHTAPLESVSQKDLEGVGTFQTNDSCLAVAKLKNNMPLERESGEYLLALDDIRDPGNLGAIIRIADWYGISKIICSKDTTDWYNPKVIAASKGSFTRVQPYYTNLEEYFMQQPESTFIAGAFLGGDSLHRFDFPGEGGFIVMGNESNGIGEGVSRFISHRITIPRFGEAESLNVGMATAVIIDNLRRGLGK